MTIIYYKKFHFIGLSNSCNTIKTIPKLINNEFAYGFDNLTLKARFIKPNKSNCEWVVEGKKANDLGVDSTIIFNNMAQCGEAAPCHEENVGGFIYVNTNITISKPITYNVHAHVLCGFDDKFAIWNGFSKSRLIAFKIYFQRNKCFFKPTLFCFKFFTKWIASHLLECAFAFWICVSSMIWNKDFWLYYSGNLLESAVDEGLGVPPGHVAVNLLIVTTGYIFGKDNEKYFGKEGKILGTILGFRCTLCSFRVFLDLYLLLQVSVKTVLKFMKVLCTFAQTL